METSYSNLTDRGVSIIRTEENGTIWRKAYSNSELGRLELQQEVEEPFYSEILDVWGEEPTVFPLPQEEQPEPSPTAQDLINADLYYQLALLQGGDQNEPEV